MKFNILTVNLETDIMNLVVSCRDDLNAKKIYQWNENYPTWEIINEDILNNEAYGLFDNDKLVSIFALNTKEDPLYKTLNWSFKNEKALIIHRLAVLPSYQGKGIGKKVLKFAEEFCSKKNLKSIRLDAFSLNTAANNLYLNFGYTYVGKLTFRGRIHHNNCYEKLIKKG